jgi:hypothetical protein
MSTMLSGWRIRLFDQGGQPLYNGKVEFFDASTSLPKTVYEDMSLSVALGVEVTTDAEGYLPVVWLASGLYKATVSQKIQEDPELWNPLYTINDLGTVATTGTGGTGEIAFVDTVASMKGLASGSVGAVLCAGYYSAGDCGEPLFFTYQSSSLASDNGGSYIKGNDIAGSSPGRYQQQFSDIIDIRQFGGIPDNNSVDCIGPYINLSNYAGDVTVFTFGPPTIGFLKAGDYNISGDLSMDGTWEDTISGITKLIPHRIEQGVCFTSASLGNTVTISNPTVINSDLKIVEYPVGLSILTGSMPYTRPQWIANYAGNLVNKIYSACTWGLPVKVYGLGCDEVIQIDTDYSWTGGDVELNVGDNFRIETLFNATLTINSKLTVVGDKFVFLRTLGNFTLAQRERNAAWFGWGRLSGNNQAQAITDAVANAQNGTIITIPKSSNASHGIYSAVSCGRDLGKTICQLRIESPLLIPTGGSLSTFSLVDAEDCQQFNITGSGSVTNCYNTEIRPSWFGVIGGSYTAYIGNNHTNMVHAITCAKSNGAVLTNGGRKIQITGPMEMSTISNLQTLNMRDIYFVADASAFSGGNYMLDIAPSTADGNINLDTVYFDTNGVSGLKSVYIYAYYLRMSKCFTMGDCVVAATDYVYSNNQHVGTTDTTGFRFISAETAGIITSNTFSDAMVVLRGTSTTPSTRDFPMLENLIFNDNAVVNTDGTPAKGCVFLCAAEPATLVNGLQICNNTFGGNISSVNDIDRTRIRDKFEGDGSWNNDTDNPANDVRHLMIIKDNTYEWFDPWHDSGGGVYVGHRQNFIPATSGTTKFYVNLASGSVSGAITYKTFGVLPDAYTMFQLTGDTNTDATISALTIAGYRSQSGVVSNYYPLVGGNAVMTGVLRANTSSTNAMIGWLTSQISWGSTSNEAQGFITFKIYEEF